MVGINNNGEVAGFRFDILPAAPSILTEPDGTLFRKPSVKRGSYTTFYATGMGDVSPALLTGFSPTTTVIAEPAASAAAALRDDWRRANLRAVRGGWPRHDRDAADQYSAPRKRAVGESAAGHQRQWKSRALP